MGVAVLREVMWANNLLKSCLMPSVLSDAVPGQARRAWQNVDNGTPVGAGLEEKS